MSHVGTEKCTFNWIMMILRCVNIYIYIYTHALSMYKLNSYYNYYRIDIIVVIIVVTIDINIMVIQLTERANYRYHSYYGHEQVHHTQCLHVCIMHLHVTLCICIIHRVHTQSSIGNLTQKWVQVLSNALNAWGVLKPIRMYNPLSYLLHILSYRNLAMQILNTHIQLSCARQ